MSREIFKQTETLLANVQAALKSAMLDEVERHYIEMSRVVLDYGSGFSPRTIELMKVANLLGDALVILDKECMQDPRLAKVEKAANDGKKIEAIKELRTISHLGLKDSKDAVEYFMERRGWTESVLESLDACEEAQRRAREQSM